MRESLAIVLISLFAVPIQAQQPTQVPQQQVMQVECRDMATSGNYIAPNETLINGKACRPAGSPLQVVDPNAKPVSGNSTVSDNGAATVAPVAVPWAVRSSR